MLVTDLVGQLVEIVTGEREPHQGGNRGRIRSVYRDRAGNVRLVLQLAKCGRLYPVFCNDVKVVTGE